MVKMLFYIVLIVAIVWVGTIVFKPKEHVNPADSFSIVKDAANTLNTKVRVVGVGKNLSPITELRNVELTATTYDEAGEEISSKTIVIEKIGPNATYDFIIDVDNLRPWKDYTIEFKYE